MKRLLMASLFAAGTAFGAFALPHAQTASAQSAAPKSGMPGMTMSGTDTEYMTAMKNMDTAMMGAGMTGDPDHDFLTMMIPHHAGAIAMARIELQHGKNSVVKRLALQTLQENERSAAALKAVLMKTSR